MDRCHGITKAGTRCKRQVPQGSRFCAGHADQAQGPGNAAAARDAASPEQASQDALIILAVAGAVLYVLMTLRRFSWFL